MPSVCPVEFVYHNTTCALLTDTFLLLQVSGGSFLRDYFQLSPDKRVILTGKPWLSDGPVA